MGLLSVGTPLEWKDTRNYAEHVRDNGTIQLINCFKAAINRNNDKFLWGDEVEYMLVKIDDDSKTAKLAIDKDYILTSLNEDGEHYQKALDSNVIFHPEYGRFMIEATPLKPYDGENLDDYLYVEKNMQLRRAISNNELDDSTIKPLTLTSFPRMGVEDFTFPKAEPNGNASKSLFLPDEIINRHVRFPTLTANIRRRRDQKVAINIPIYKDKFTKSIDPMIPKNRNLFPFSDNESTLGAAKPGHIYMDSMGFGMGSSCLQVTMQASNINEARYIYDSLVNIAPLMLSLTSAAPIFRGLLADQDVRWNVIAGAVDDRTPYERSEKPLQGHSEIGNTLSVESLQRIPKSRYDSVDQYLGDINNGEFNYFKSEYNDLNSPINEKVLKTLINNGFDQTLANHFAHLFIRDPIVIFNERLNQDNETETDHFENIQSTNWQTLRFKPPNQSAIPTNNKTPGWRVELRPMEISITDFENAAFADFSILLSRAILKYKPNFYLPISKVEENMKTAHVRDSTINCKFNFRVNVWNNSDSPIIRKLTLNEIFNGCDEFEGLISIVEKYINETFKDEKDKVNGKLSMYLKLVSYRSSGKIKTTAKFIRDFVINHKSYEHDSVVNDSINYDLIKILSDLSNYDHDIIKEFFGDEISKWMISNGY
ncbi:hypothetical protein CANARDRAFT_6389 [[Candida] arabinofermentans NRRL YB-2248]|uniref:Glutamate--cysteine ligase n=1 Tax=[Candida] arabinofermentans NRRL YB-2248 TaxID=983967 RepID=A0A1E4T521_9ASCO|nr:hypothetical protein CANARDRAFT_6389 [[Candida] arabinofermentans NRRL YB-2248]